MPIQSDFFLCRLFLSAASLALFLAAQTPQRGVLAFGGRSNLAPHSGQVNDLGLNTHVGNPSPSDSDAVATAPSGSDDANHPGTG